MLVLSLDIETSGKNWLDPKVRIVEIGAALDDLSLSRDDFGDSKFDFHCYIDHGDDIRWEEGARKMHERSGLIDKIKDPSTDHKTFNHSGRALFFMAKWIVDRTSILRGEDFSTNPPLYVNVAGKNFSSFDRPFIDHAPKWEEPKDSDFSGDWEQLIRFRRRVLDPAMLYMIPQDQMLPNLSICKKRAGMEDKVRHEALQDAKDVLKLLRNRLQ